MCRVKFNIEFLVYFLKYKSDVFVSLKQNKMLIEKQTCKKIVFGELMVWIIT